MGIKGERGGDNWRMNTIIPDSTKQTNRDEKSLRHVAMVAKFLDGNTISNFTDLIQFHLI